MKRLGLLSSLVLYAASVSASLQPVGPVPFSGTGLGSVNTVLTVGRTPAESGCVARGPAGDIIGPAACPPGFAGGDERTGASQTQTRTIGELGLTTAEDLRIVLNVNESTGNSAILSNLALTIYSPTGTVLFTSGAFTPPTFPLTHSPGTTVGYVFELDDAQAAQAQLVFDPTNRVGIAATFSTTSAGNETFFVADVTAVGTPITGADVAITKTAPPNAIAGTDLVYTMSVVNNGPLAATNVVVNDPLPGTTRFVSLAAAAGWTCSTPPVGGSGTVNCTKASMAVGETGTFTATVRICPELGCGTPLTNTATITSSVIDPVTANGTSTTTTNVQAQSDVAISKSASAGSVNPGGTVIYTLNVVNAGPSNSAGTVVVDNLPAGFTAVDASTTAGTCGGTGTGTITCNLGTLGAAGQCTTALPVSATITVTAQASAAAAPGTYTNSATVSTGNCLADPDLTNNTTTVATNIPAGPVDADLAISKIAPPTAVAGTNVTYTLTVTNSGPLAAADVVVTEPLPAQTRFISHSAPSGWTCTTPASGTPGTVTCSKSAVAVAETATFSTVVRTCPEVVCATVVTNSATVSSSTTDVVPANNTSTASVSLQTQSDLAITKSASPPSIVAGDTVTYVLNVSNAGPSNSAGTVVIDTLPAGFTAIAAAPSTGTCSGAGSSTITCSLGELGAASQCAMNRPQIATITITAQASAAVPSGSAINSASVSTANCLADPNIANNTATASTAVGGPLAAAVPTLSEWALIVFALLLLAAGIHFIRV